MTQCVRPINYDTARRLIWTTHYSRIMPRLTKLTLGSFLDDRLVGVCTLGWGVRPLHTIRILFPSLGTADYLEIGKLCMLDEMPKNSESHFISLITHFIRKQLPDVRLLFTWADGIIGKPGYVYQASNFYYGGYILTEMYLNSEGVRVHPRTMQGLTSTHGRGSRSRVITEALGFTKYWGRMFRYVYPLCDKNEWQRLQRESPMLWRRGNYPKDADCIWYKQTNNQRQSCERPPFRLGARVVRETSQIDLLTV